jgi:acylphosphatase
MNMKHLSIHVSGKVQGVFFRASTKEKADEFKIKGIVRNNADGSVSIEAEGEGENLQRFIAWCKRGPKFARVEACEVNDGELRNYKSFTIER